MSDTVGEVEGGGGGEEGEGLREIVKEKARKCD